MNDVDDDCNYNMDHVGIDYGSWPVQQNTYCGNLTAFDVYSTYPAFQMYVSFLAIPIGVRGKRGFKAHFEAVEAPDLTHTGICTVLITYLILLFLSLYNSSEYHICHLFRAKGVRFLIGIASIFEEGLVITEHVRRFPRTF